MTCYIFLRGIIPVWKIAGCSRLFSLGWVAVAVMVFIIVTKTCLQVKLSQLPQ
ncbi:hypothetical protein [Sporomusa silvacetica]|uniref:hypothetical protein n=1 Tax=Sporomusa silvacetica TaxID=55504 RepID=UPI00146F6655|nr:hypothetical protein [Sporomusa silvacetica]